ncbi:MAG: response regulator [Hydrogenophaga sp.]|nr:response regulator [Hydrogenophaga sp.]
MTEKKISTVMVVDDSKSSRKVNTALLHTLLGDTVLYLEAASGESALEQLAAQPVDVVLLDLTMPGISGFDVLAALQERHSEAQVIVVSADIQRLARQRVESLGAAGFIAKPIQIDALRAELVKLEVLHG